MAPIKDSVERWSGIRLWVYRNRHGRAPVALILRTQEGASRREQLVARGEIDVDPGSLASASILGALVAGLVDLYGEVEVANALRMVPPRRWSAPPPGATGAVYLEP